MPNPNDDIPFGENGDSTLGVAPLVNQSDVERRASASEQARKDFAADLAQRGVAILPPTTEVTKKECFLAILNGMAARGDFSLRVAGSTGPLQGDESIRNAARHAAGIASYFHEAAKAAKI